MTDSERNKDIRKELQTAGPGITIHTLSKI